MYFALRLAVVLALAYVGVFLACFSGTVAVPPAPGKKANRNIIVFSSHLKTHLRITQWFSPVLQQARPRCVTPTSQMHAELMRSPAANMESRLLFSWFLAGAWTAALVGDFIGWLAGLRRLRLYAVQLAMLTALVMTARSFANGYF